MISLAFMIAILVVLLGLCLLTAGREFISVSNRRKGTDLHCRGCGYNLTGGSGKICPECGKLLTTKTIVVGELGRRSGLIVVECYCSLGSAHLNARHFADGILL